MIEALAKVLGGVLAAIMAERARADAEGRVEIDRLLAEARALIDVGAVTRAATDEAERLDRG